MPDSSCPSPGSVLGFVLGTLPESEAEMLAAHLEWCASCDALAEKLEGKQHSLIAHLREPVADLNCFQDPAFNSAVDHLIEICRQQFPITQTFTCASEVETHPQAVPALPEYDDFECIGQGGMGVVWKARDTALDRWVAIKMPHDRAGGDEDYRDRFKKEARAVAQLHHPSLCEIYEVGECDGRPYLAMAYVHGETLASQIRSRSFTTREAATLVATLARAVAHAHEKGVVHRDIKPSNVMIEAQSGTPVLMDFGLARDLFRADAELTHFGQVLGTPAYMPPEQAAGKRDDVGPLADVYALGVVLYELLTHRRPFLGTVAEILQALQSDDPISPQTIEPRLSRDLETICLKAMAKAPASRYASAIALAEDLDRFLNGDAILARRESMIEKAGRLVRKHVRVAVLFSVFLITTIVISSYVLIGSRELRRRTETAEQVDRVIQAKDWTAQSLMDTEDMLAQLKKSDARAAMEHQQRLWRGLASYIRNDLIGRPAITPRDQETIEKTLALLALRDPVAEQDLRLQYERRLRHYDEVFRMTAPLQTLPDEFAGSPAAVSDGKLVRDTPLDPSQSGDVLLSNVPSIGNVRLEVTFTGDFLSAEQVGLILFGGRNRGYFFVLRRSPPTTADERATAQPASQAGARRESSGECLVEIARNGVVLRRQRVAMWKLNEPGTPLWMQATCENRHLTFSVGNTSLEFDDLFAASTAGRGAFGVLLPAGVEISLLVASKQVLPAEPSSLEQGDELFARGAWAESLEWYAREVQKIGTQGGRDEARLKEALCLIQLQRDDQAEPLLVELQVAPDERVRSQAACQLWLLLLGQRRADDAEILLSRLTALYRFDELSRMLPDADRSRMVSSALMGTSSLNLFRFNDGDLANLKRADAVQQMVKSTEIPDDIRKLMLMRGYHITGRIDEALLRFEHELTSPSLDLRGIMVNVFEEYLWLLREKGLASQALKLVDATRARLGPAAQGESDRLLVARARILAALGRSSEAESDLDRFLSSPRCSEHYLPYSSGRLMRGLLYDDQGNHDKAVAEWREGLFKSWIDDAKVVDNHESRLTLTGMELGNALMLAALSQDCGEEDLLRLARTANLIPGHDRVLQFIGPYLNRGAAVVRGMAADRRARELLRKNGFQQCDLKQYLRTPLLLAALEFARLESLDRQWTADEAMLLWQAGQDAFDQLAERRLHLETMPWALSTWLGNSSQLGWKTLEPKLSPELRGPMAFLLGFRYLRLNRSDDARRFFETAIAIAPPDSLLKRLANSEFQKLMSAGAP